MWIICHWHWWMPCLCVVAKTNVLLIEQKKMCKTKEDANKINSLFLITSTFKFIKLQISFWCKQCIYHKIHNWKCCWNDLIATKFNSKKKKKHQNDLRQKQSRKCNSFTVLEYFERVCVILCWLPLSNNFKWKLQEIIFIYLK